MIQMETMLAVADNTGARSAKMIGVLGKRSRTACVGDVITALQGRVIDDSTELVVAIRSFAPGDVVELEILRDGKRSMLDLTLGELKAG